MATQVYHRWHFVQRKNVAVGDEVCVNRTACKMVSSLLSVHPVGPEIWGAFRMLLSFWFADSPLLCCPTENKLLMWFMFQHMVTRGVSSMTAPASASALKISSRCTSNILPTCQFHPHTFWRSRLGMIVEGKCHSVWKPFFF